MKPRKLLMRIVAWALLAAVYFFAAKYGLKLAFLNVSATAVWPATGIALAALLVFSRKMWPGVFIGAFLANITTAGTVATTVGIAAGNTLEAVVGAYLVNRFAGGVSAFERTADFFRFVLFAALLSTMVSATIGVTSLALGGFVQQGTYGAVWLTWWLGDAIGALAIAPLLILWRDFRFRWTLRQAAEALVLTLLMCAAAFAIFGGVFLKQGFPLEFLLVPFVIWAAYRFGSREAALAAVILSGIAIWGTLHGFGPFYTGSPNESLLLLQSFIGVVVIVGLAIAIEDFERRRLEWQRKLLTASIAHQFTAPVNVLRGFSELLLRKRRGLTSVQRTAATEIRQNAESLAETVDRFIHTSRFQASTFTPQPQDIDLKSILIQEIKRFRHEASRKGLTLRVSIGRLPSVNADPLLIRDVIEILLDNAISYTKKGSIVVRALVEGGSALICVQDTGIGLSRALRSTLFADFSPSANMAGLNAGLGLWMCKKIVDAHGGTITAESPGQNQGSTFCFTLPLKPRVSG